MESKDLLVGKGGPDGSSSSPKEMESKDLLVGKGGPDGSPSSPKAMESRDLLVDCMSVYVQIYADIFAYVLLRHSGTSGRHSLLVRASPCASADPKTS